MNLEEIWVRNFGTTYGRESLPLKPEIPISVRNRNFLNIIRELLQGFPVVLSKRHVSHGYNLALSLHHTITIIDQYDGDDETSAQRRRAWKADEPSYYGHPSSSPQSPKLTEVAQLDICSAFCFRARRLSLIYETERIAAVGQGSFLLIEEPAFSYENTVFSYDETFG